MFLQLKIFFSVLLVTNFVSSCKGGVVQPTNQLSRIAWGEDSSIEKHPHLVGVERKGRDFYCAGSLISSTCVLTAAHCMHDIPAEDFTIRGGTTLYREGGYVRYVKDYRAAENYDRATVDMDVAVIKLKEPMNGENVTTIDIDYGYENNNGNDLIAVGWGRTEYNSRASEYLKETNVTLWSREKCQLAFDISSTIFGSAKTDITENMLCAFGADRNATCKGDSGGPIIQSGKQVGIVSFGSGDCGWAALPDVNTNLKSHKIQQFLIKTTQEFNCWG